MKTAEDIIQKHGLKKSAVISGVGSREYYKNKCDYFREGTYMVKFMWNIIYVKFIITTMNLS